MNERIKISVRSKDVISISLLEPLQGDLKVLPEDNYRKLKNEILADGFSFAVHVYEDISDGKIYIIDGHQRVSALNRMKEEGFSIPQIPVVFVEAENLDHAKKKVLAAASQYGEFNQQGAENFIRSINGIDLETLRDNFQMPAINFDIINFAEPNKVLVSEHLRDLNNSNDQDQDVSGLTSDDQNFYSKKIATPIYEPIGEKPAINDLIDLSKYNSLCDAIAETSLSKDEKEFLVLAASRHLIFNYEQIANYYAHSDKQLQQLFENSALVVIDFNKAVENGFIKLSKEIYDGFMNNLEKNNETLEEGLTI